jgi:nicotinamide-nucleotide amidase
VRGLYRDELLPRIAAKIGSAEHCVQSYALRTTGVAESQLPDMLREYAAEIDGMRLAYQPSPSGVDIRLTISGVTRAEGKERLERAAAILSQRIGHYVYGSNGQDLVSVVLDACRKRGWHIAMAESCTGGMLGERLTRYPGSSDVVFGGVIAYSNAIKETMLNVPKEDLKAHGAVSEPVVLAMAKGARHATGAEVGLAITGVAGPDGGTPEKPVGTVWQAIDTPLGSRAYVWRHIGDRDEIRFRSTQTVLDLLRRQLSET